MHRQLCDVCLKPIGDAQALFVNGKLVHLKCGEGITENGVTAAEKKWHSNCLRCSKCQRLLSSTFLYDKKGEPIDHDCFWGERLQNIVADSFKA
uniref:LIM zinc-binding domain-containing protein n=1 Tax=Panagrolaimus sp. PS1159 TaxID=55785 RepID=A0AC35G227_9BILA